MHKEFRLSIRLANDAMQSPGDVGDALIKIGRALNDFAPDFPASAAPVMDANGNLVGEYRVITVPARDDAIPSPTQPGVVHHRSGLA